MHGNVRIRGCVCTGMVTTLAGSGSMEWVDGIGTNAGFLNPSGISVDSSGVIYVSEYDMNVEDGHWIRKISSTGASGVGRIVRKVV